MLRWKVRSMEQTIQFLQLITLLVEEEILSWRNKGQWSSSDQSVKRELAKVNIMSQYLFVCYRDVLSMWSA